MLMQNSTEEWVETVKKLQSPQPGERTVFFDEFAVYDRPSLFYGWAERNTRPPKSRVMNASATS